MLTADQRGALGKRISVEHDHSSANGTKACCVRNSESIWSYFCQLFFLPNLSHCGVCHMHNSNRSGKTPFLQFNRENKSALYSFVEKSRYRDGVWVS